MCTSDRFALHETVVFIFYFLKSFSFGTTVNLPFLLLSIVCFFGGEIKLEIFFKITSL